MKYAITLDKIPKPLVYSISLDTKSDNWLLKFKGAYLMISLEGIEKENKTVFGLASPFYIHAQRDQKQPTVTYNPREVRFKPEKFSIDIDKCIKFKLEIKLTEIELKDNETFSFQFSY